MSEQENNKETQYAAEASETTSGRDDLPPVIEIRRQAVDTLDYQRQLECRRRAAEALADRLEDLAIEALSADRTTVRHILDQRVEALKQAESLAEQLRAVRTRANALKHDLLQGGQPAA